MGSLCARHAAARLTVGAKGAGRAVGRVVHVRPIPRRGVPDVRAAERDRQLDDIVLIVLIVSAIVDCAQFKLTRYVVGQVILENIREPEGIRTVFKFVVPDAEGKGGQTRVNGIDHDALRGIRGLGDRDLVPGAGVVHGFCRYRDLRRCRVDRQRRFGARWLVCCVAAVGGGDGIGVGVELLRDLRHAVGDGIVGEAVVVAAAGQREGDRAGRVGGQGGGDDRVFAVDDGFGRQGHFRRDLEGGARRVVLQLLHSQSRNNAEICYKGISREASRNTDRSHTVHSFHTEVLPQPPERSLCGGIQSDSPNPLTLCVIGGSHLSCLIHGRRVWIKNVSGHIANGRKEDFVGGACINIRIRVAISVKLADLDVFLLRRRECRVDEIFIQPRPDVAVGVIVGSVFLI